MHLHRDYFLETFKIFCRVGPVHLAVVELHANLELCLEPSSFAIPAPGYERVVPPSGKLVDYAVQLGVQKG